MTEAVQVLRHAGTQGVTVLFPPSWFRVVRGARQNLTQTMGDRPRAVMAVDGHMFESTAGSDKFAALDTVNGVLHTSTLPHEGLTVSVVGGRARGVYGGELPRGATVALQTWPSLVLAGRVVPHDTAANRERVWRAGFGVHRDGRLVVVVMVGTMLALSQKMVAEGVTEGGYLDGGHSVALEVRDGVRRVHTAPDGSQVPTWILAQPPEGVTPSVQDSGAIASVALPALGVAGLVLLVCGFVYLVRRKD